MKRTLVAIAGLVAAATVALAPSASAGVTACYDVQATVNGSSVVSESACHSAG